MVENWQLGVNMARFHRVASVGEIPPGEMKAVEIEGTPVALYNVNGEFFATCDTCSHEEASLAEGWLDDDVVTCPSHGAEFNVRTGEVLALPATEPIATYPVRVEGDEVFVAVSA
jgi:3-phenylpropionate/trans-cinnamate dioxygenase ferredoxin component